MIRRTPFLKERDYTVNEEADSHILRREYSFSLITPMMGGGAKSWELDLKNPVRAQSVKGQLRFWWRTMQDTSDHGALLLKESAVWGGITRGSSDNEKEKRIKSRVTLSICNQDIPAGGIVSPKTAHSWLQYVMFPLIAGNNGTNSRVKIIEKLFFTLKISIPPCFEEEVINTLKLWTLFGGVGARTRRGTGSICCEALLSEFHDEHDIALFLKRVSGSENHKMPYPRLAGGRLFAEKFNNVSPSKIWKEYLENYGKYRQSRGTDKNKYGRFHWPEPDAVRSISGEHSSRHPPNSGQREWFPRAAFGLPILMGFSTQYDPGKRDRSPRLTQNISLEPDIGSGDRYPSPLILKVIKLPNGIVVRCAYLLNQTFPCQLVLKLNYPTASKTEHRIQGDMLPFFRDDCDNPKISSHRALEGISIYEDLADELKLKEVTCQDT